MFYIGIRISDKHFHLLCLSRVLEELPITHDASLKIQDPSLSSVGYSHLHMIGVTKFNIDPVQHGLEPDTF